MEKRYKAILFILALIGFFNVYDYLLNSITEDKEQDIKRRQGLVYDYDYFKSECKEYFYQNKILDEKNMKNLFEMEIEEDILFEKEIDIYDKDETYEERYVDLVCDNLEDFSKNESEEVIYDIYNPTKEDFVTKECDSRGCVYSN